MPKGREEAGLIMHGTKKEGPLGFIRDGIGQGLAQPAARATRG